MVAAGLLLRLAAARLGRRRARDRRWCSSPSCSTRRSKRVVDLASPQDHPLAKRAKDVAAAAVLVAALAAAAVGIAVLVAALAGPLTPERLRACVIIDPRLSTDPLPSGRRGPTPQ